MYSLHDPSSVLDKHSARIIIAVTTGSLNAMSSGGATMGTKTAWLTGLAAAMLTAMSAGAQQAVPPENAALPDMPKQATRLSRLTGHRGAP